MVITRFQIVTPCLLQAITELKKCDFPIFDSISNTNSACPWTPNPIKVFFTPISKNQATLCPAYANALHLEISDNFATNTIKVYCDGSYFKNDDRAAAAFFIPQLNLAKSWTLRNGSSILTAELSAIDVALNSIYQIVNAGEEVIIFSDSSSALKLLKSKPESHPISINISKTISNYTSSGSKVSFVWIPSHVGIMHNETVDSLAQTENKTPSNFIQNVLSYSEKTNIAKKQFQKIKMSTIESQFPFPKILPYHPTPKNWFSHNTNRVATVALHRIRSGHNRLNSHQSKYKPVLPFCRRGCNEKEDSEHLFLKCAALDANRVKITKIFEKHKIPFNLQTLLGCNFTLTGKQQLIIRNSVVSFLTSSKMIQEI